MPRWAVVGVLVALAGCAAAPPPPDPAPGTGPWAIELEADLTLNWPQASTGLAEDDTSCTALGSGRDLRIRNLTATLRWTPVANHAQRLLLGVKAFGDVVLDSSTGPTPLTLSVPAAHVWPKEYLGFYAFPEDADAPPIVDQALRFRLTFEYASEARPQLGPLRACTV